MSSFPRNFLPTAPANGTRRGLQTMRFTRIIERINFKENNNLNRIETVLNAFMFRLSNSIFLTSCFAVLIQRSRVEQGLVCFHCVHNLIVDILRLLCCMDFLCLVCDCPSNGFACGTQCCCGFFMDQYNFVLLFMYHIGS